MQNSNLNKYYIFSLIIFLSYGSIYAQSDIDSTKIKIHDEIKTSPADNADTTKADTTQRSGFDDKYSDFIEKKQPQLRLSFFDSLAVYIIPSTLNLADQIEQTNYRDAGDYFRFDPSFFVLENQASPMRKTVRPFGLNGGHINYQFKDISMSPLEHLPEPDGMYDFNDFPTALNKDVYILPGAAGMIFNGRSAVASMITIPEQSEGNSAITGFKSDKGSHGYSYTRGDYSRKFRSGKEIDMSIGYRKGDGVVFGRGDDSYHYFGDFYVPVNHKLSVRTVGQLYNRDGFTSVHPDNVGASFFRKRFDRNLWVSVVKQNDSADVKNEIGYHHLRQGSYTDTPYKTRINITEHGLFANREWSSGNSIAQINLKADYQKFDQAVADFDRATGDVSFSKVNYSHNSSYAFTFGSRYGLHIGINPRSAFVLTKKQSKSLFMFSAGFAFNEPTLHELHKEFQTDVLYRVEYGVYSDGGNSNLKSEKELIGSFYYQFGLNQNNLSLTVTGGKIFDNISWMHQEDLGVGASHTFLPENVDVDFVTLTLKNKIQFKNLIKFNCGGSYHFINTTEKNDRYQPEFQFFAGSELHYFWYSKLIHLTAYSDVVFTDYYHGYFEENLGRDWVVNSKLAIRIKEFQFSFVFVNTLNNSFWSREYSIIPGSYTYYSVTWDFLD